MSEKTDSAAFRKKQSLDIITQYKDLIDKYDALFDKDLLQKELEKMQSLDDDDDKKAESEQKYLAKLKSRRVALEEKEGILEKIEALEKHLEDPSKENGKVDSSAHPAKRHSRTN